MVSPTSLKGHTRCVERLKSDSGRQQRCVVIKVSCGFEQHSTHRMIQFWVEFEGKARKLANELDV
jgi:hypothetical protein